MAPVLNSDHVNYLIWRYLQEQGYSHSALSLARDWHHDPETLGFAHAVKPDTLICLLQDGLGYGAFLDHEASRRSETTAAPRDPQPSRTSARYDFINVHKRRASSSPRRSPNGTNTAQTEDASRKRLRLHASSSPTTEHTPIATSAPTATATQRPVRPTEPHTTLSRSNSKPPAPADLPSIRYGEAATDTIMDMDVEPKSKASLPTLEIGKNIGLQVDLNDAVRELKQMIFHRDLNNVDFISHVSWSPDDATSLTVAGSPMFRTYNVPTSTLNRTENGELDFVDLGPKNAPFSLPALARPAKGQIFAYSVDDEEGCRVKVHSTSGSRTLESSRNMCHVLKLNPSGSHLLAVWASVGSDGDPAEDEAGVDVYDLSAGLRLHTLRSYFLDAEWTTDSQFLLLTEQSISLYNISTDQINLVNNLPQKDGSELWQYAKVDPSSNHVACSITKIANSGDTLSKIAMLDVASFTTRVLESSDVPIRVVEWQPSTVKGAEQKEASLLVTCNDNAMISVWRVTIDSHEKVWSKALPRNIVPQHLAFSPDGLFFAVCGDNTVLVSKIDGAHNKWAVWSGKGEVTRADEGTVQMIAWNSEGKKLAYGRNGSLTIWDLER